LGQVADAIATPFVGFESDRNDTSHWLCRYGRRKTWHLIGTILVTISIPFIFNECIECENASETSKLLYYSAFIVMFQFGWAAVQVGHVSLIIDLTPISKERIELNSYRYGLNMICKKLTQLNYRQAATIAANICVYTITWLLLSQKGDSTINKEDSGIFTVYFAVFDLLLVLIQKSFTNSSWFILLVQLVLYFLYYFTFLYENLIYTIV
jgi:Na+/melibiose symporter-like transporter